MSEQVKNGARTDQLLGQVGWETLENVSTFSGVKLATKAAKMPAGTVKQTAQNAGKWIDDKAIKARVTVETVAKPAIDKGVKATATAMRNHPVITAGMAGAATNSASQLYTTGKIDPVESLYNGGVAGTASLYRLPAQIGINSAYNAIWDYKNGKSVEDISKSTAATAIGSFVGGKYGIHPTSKTKEAFGGSVISETTKQVSLPFIEFMSKELPTFNFNKNNKEDKK